MKTITKYFDSSKKAGQYQTRLCNQYNHVNLIRSPRFAESGTYMGS